MTAFAFLIAFIPVSAGCGWSLVARLDANRALTDVERFCISFVIGTLFFYFSVFAVGLVRLDRVSMIPLALSATLLSMPGLRAMARSGLRDTVISLFEEARRDRWIALLWIAIIGIGATSLLQSWAPPNDYDSLNYHLAAPQFDVENARISPPWLRGQVNAFYPAGMYHLYRLALVLADSSAAQAIQGFFGVIAAIMAASIAGRMGAPRHVALLAALFFLASRVVIWEMGTVAGDVAVTAWFALSLGVYLIWRQKPSAGFLILLGIIVGGGVLAKYHGAVAALCIAALLLVDFVRKRISILSAVIVPTVSFAVFAPHLIYMYLLTGNPFFPLANSIFLAGGTDFFDSIASSYGTGRGLFDFLTTPVSLSIFPMHYFDGMILVL